MIIYGNAKITFNDGKGTYTYLQSGNSIIQKYQDISINDEETVEPSIPSSIQINGETVTFLSEENYENLNPGKYIAIGNITLKNITGNNNIYIDLNGFTCTCTGSTNGVIFYGNNI